MTEKEYIKIINKLVMLVGYAIGATSGCPYEHMDLDGDMRRLNKYLTDQIQPIMDQLNEDD